MSDHLRGHHQPHLLVGHTTSKNMPCAKACPAKSSSQFTTPPRRACPSATASPHRTGFYAWPASSATCQGHNGLICKLEPGFALTSWSCRLFRKHGSACTYKIPSLRSNTVQFGKRAIARLAQEAIQACVDECNTAPRHIGFQTPGVGGRDKLWDPNCPCFGSGTLPALAPELFGSIFCVALVIGQCPLTVRARA